MPLFTKSDLTRGRVFKNSRSEAASVILEKASQEVLEDEIFDIFLSHRYTDAEEILKLKNAIEEMGFLTYVDWIVDRSLDRSKVNKRTAKLLRTRMGQCKSLFFVDSENSPDSKWMPWELGYFDGLKQKVAVLPILEQNKSTESYDGQEYLGLYPYVSKGVSESTKHMTLWIHENSNTYVSCYAWLKGSLPTIHA